MVDFTNELEKIKPINIKAIEFNHYKIHKSVCSSIVLYNQSISNLKMDCIPLAITNLKQSLSLNPGFCEAIKLLGLCYVAVKDFKKAEKCFKKLSKYPLYNTVVNDYIKDLSVEKTSLQAIEAIRRVSLKSFDVVEDDEVSVAHRYMTSNKKTIKSIKKYSLHFYVLITMVLIISSVYLLRSNFQAGFVKTEKSKGLAASPIKKDTEVVKNKVVEEKDSRLDKDFKELQQKLETTSSELNNYKSKYEVLQYIENAERFQEGGNIEKTAENLLKLKSLPLDDTTKARFDKLWKIISSGDAWKIYNEGNSLYKQGKYQEALPKLKIAQGFVPDQKLMPWILYQIGVCYKEIKDNENALVYFQSVKDNYPNTEYAGYSDSSISEMKK